MKKSEIEEIFEKIRDCLEFHFRNAEDKEDLINRINQSINEMEENCLKEAE